MPTLRNRTTKPGYCVRWKPHPEHGRPSTYQITDRARQFLRELGYSVPQSGDEVEISDDLCRPLRKLGDLHFKDEERPGDVELTDVTKISQTFGRQLSEEEEVALRAYIESHPRFNNNAERLEEELDKLPDTGNTDTVGSDNSNVGPADTVDVDIEELLDDEDTYFSEDIRESLKEWAPSSVNTENENRKGMAKKKNSSTTFKEFRKAVAEIPNATDSIIEMRDKHERDVMMIYIDDGNALRFSFERYQPDWGCDWGLSVIDGRYTEQRDADLEFQFIPEVRDIRVGLKRFIIHRIEIDDHQFSSWEIEVDDTSVPLGECNDVLSDAEFHRVLHDQTVLLRAVERFIEELPEYYVGQPSEWLDRS